MPLDISVVFLTLAYLDMTVGKNHADPEWVDRLITIAEASEWPMPLIACAV